MSFIALSFLFVLLSSASACDRCLHQSKATFTSEISSGGCGYDSLAQSFNGDLLASALPSIFKNGAGCGACFKVRCKDTRFCRTQGTTIMVTDSQGDKRADFVLNKNAFGALAYNGMSQNLLNLGIVDIEYKRVPCDFNQNLAVIVENYSSKPYYLAILVLYQSGQTDIVGVDVASVGSSKWTSMKRNHGAVWDTSNVPAGALMFRFLVNSGFGNKYVLTQQVLPSDWRSGPIYNAGIKITDLAQENCPTCDTSSW